MPTMSSIRGPVNVDMDSLVHVTEMVAERSHTLVGVQWKKRMYITKQSGFANDMIIFHTYKLPTHYGKRNTSQNQFCGRESGSYDTCRSEAQA